MALLEKLSVSCQREKINAQPSSPGEPAPPSTPSSSQFLSNLPISFFVPFFAALVFLTQAKMACNPANKSYSKGVALNAKHRLIYFSLGELKHCWYLIFSHETGNAWSITRQRCLIISHYYLISLWLTYSIHIHFVSCLFFLFSIFQCVHFSLGSSFITLI